MNDVIAYLPAILAGSLVTLKVGLMALVLALALGLAGASAKLSRSRWLAWPATAYTSLVRGVPDLVMMLLVFYGGQVIANELTDALEWPPLEINPFTAGFVTIGFIFGAYFTETFRGAFMAVPRGQIEAGQAYGMSRWQVFSRVLFPQMLRHALPGLGNNWQVMLKSTAIVSLIGLADMTWLADQAGRTTRQPFVFYLIVCVLYLAMTWVSGRAIGWLDRKYAAGVRQPAS